MSKEGETTWVLLQANMALDKLVTLITWINTKRNFPQDSHFCETMLEDNYKFRKGIANFKS